MVRLLHTSDWHLGRFLFGKSLLEDQAFMLDRLTEIIDRVRPHGLMISGDVFDRALPPEAAVTLFDQFLSSVIREREIPVFLIPGNHDSAERLGFAAGLLRHQGLTIFSRIEDAFSPVRVQGDAGSEVLLYGIPFVDPPVVARFLKQNDIQTPDEAHRAIAKALAEKRDLSVPAVLLSHAFVSGGEISDSEKDIFIGGSAQVSAEAFSDFAYTALGHLHKPQKVGSGAAYYSGSPLQYSKSEVNHRKSINEVALDRSGLVSVTQHPIIARRPLRAIEGSLETLIADGTKDPNSNDYIIASFTDAGQVFDAFHRLRAVYPNLLHVSREAGFQNPSLSKALDRIRERREMTDLDLFAEFFRETTGNEFNDNARELLVEVLKDLDREVER